jgi:hypothetical protein
LDEQVSGIQTVEQLADSDANELQSKLDRSASDGHTSKLPKVDSYIHSARLRLGREQPPEEHRKPSKRKSDFPDEPDIKYDDDSDNAAAPHSRKRQRKAPNRFRPPERSRNVDDDDQEEPEEEDDEVRLIRSQ